MSAETEPNLRAGLKKLQLELTDGQVGQLLEYQTLIAKWTQVYNLTSVRDPAEMLTHHLLDSLAAVKPLTRYLQLAEGRREGIRLLDVGSGAGLPGAIFSICCPKLQVTCVDTVSKKVAFVTQAALALRLPQLKGRHVRVENVSEQFDVVCSRAFASLADFTSWSGVALAGQGAWMALKGKHPAEEISALPASIDVFHVEQLQVPGLNAERCIVWMKKTVT